MSRHLLALLLLGTLVPVGLAAPGNGETVWLANPSQQPRIHRVEEGLEAVTLKNGQTLRLTLAEWMALFRVPGLSVAVFDNFQVVWLKGYGTREAGSGLPVTVETTFQAGSVSKPVTALAAMRLVQEGKLSLDEDVNKRLVSWKVPDNAFTQEEKVTLRRLLSHSSGLSVHGFHGYMVGESLPTTVQVLNGEKPANNQPVRVERVPGTGFHYSGGGTTVVQLLLVDVLKKPFPQIMADTVLQPLGLTHSSYEQPPPPARAAVAATGHDLGGHPVEGKWHVYPEMAAAGLWTTPQDLAAVAIEVAKSSHGESNRLLSQATVQQMLTVQAAPLGLGFFLGPGKGQFGHDGDDEGFTTLLVAFSDSGQGFAVMTNANLGPLVFHPLAASVAREYQWPSYKPEPLSASVRCAVIASKLGAAEAVTDYVAAREGAGQKGFGPVDLNTCGYVLLSAPKVDDAVRVFEANVALYPKDSNAYDSLGEGYVASGQTQKGIENYRRSLELNPKNANAVQMLQRLGVRWTADAGAP